MQSHSECQFLLNVLFFYSLACSTHPNVKRSSEIVQIGLNEANVFQTELSTASLGPDQGLFFVFYEDDLEKKEKIHCNM